MRTRMFLAVLLPLCLAAPFDDIANYDHSDVSQVKFNEQLRLLFKIMDIDQNRLIDADELMLICLEKDIDLPSTEAERIVNHPGLLTMDKFVELLADCPSDKTEDILLYLVHAGGNGDRRERMQGFFKNLKSKFMEQITASKNKLFGKKNIGTKVAPTTKAPTTVTKAPTTVAPTTKAPSSTAPPEAPKQEGESCGRVTPTFSRGDCAEGLTCVPGRIPGAPGICTRPGSDEMVVRN